MVHARLIRFANIFALLLMLCGCARNPDESEIGPFGSPIKSQLLLPLAGRWKYDMDATRQASQPGEGTDIDADSIRKPDSDDASPSEPHPDMVIVGNQAACAGIPAAEYWFFGMHGHAGKICGKAWHHEDRLDPGDMSKCYVRLEIRNDQLYFDVKMQEAMPELSDPDLTSPPPVELDSNADCTADIPEGTGWSPWTTYVFSRAKSHSP